MKPEILKDEELWDLEQETGLPLLRAFVGLWCYADREGRFEWRPRALKTDVLPYWEGDFSRVLDALAEHQFIVRYEVGGTAYGVVRTFHKHQVINQRESKSVLPPPPEGALQCTHVPAHADEPRESFGVNVLPEVREMVFARDGHKCQRCGSSDDLTIDHVFPRCLGGTHAIANLRTLCRSCNSARPVQGKALLDDLALDGLTLADLERTCMHVRARGDWEGNGNGNGNGNGPRSPVVTLRDSIEEESPAISSVGVADRVSEQLRAVTGKRWDAMGHVDALCWIAGQRLDEWAKVKAAIAADGWCANNPGLVTPKHIRGQWPKYSDGPKAQRAKGSPVPVSTTAEFEAEPDDFEALRAAARAREAAHG